MVKSYSSITHLPAPPPLSSFLEKRVTKTAHPKVAAAATTDNSNNNAEGEQRAEMGIVEERGEKEH